jgi:argininosuccinate lyase
VAYTHGQPAQPTTFGHYLAAVIEVLQRDAARLDAAIEALGHCPMGAAAITTSGFPVDRHRVAELLGFAAPLAAIQLRLHRGGGLRHRPLFRAAAR